MRHIKFSAVIVCCLFMVLCCKKGGSGGTTKTAPTNLVINSTVSTDGSGNVSFTATAVNAVSYIYEFGNGDIKTVPSGVTTYQYTLVGTNTFTVTVTATSSSGLTLKKSAQVTVTVNASVPTLFWSDEFNTDGAPDPSKWVYDLGAGGWGNGELEYYTSRPENVIIQSGVLKITAIKENFLGSPYTSTRLKSQSKFAFTYGRVDVRAKIPAGQGTWPAIWMLGNNINTVSWPACGEIDIMEHRGSELNKIFGTLHYPGRSGGNANGSTIVIANATTEFHIYSLDWSASSIKIYVDNQLFHTVTNTSAIPFNQDFFFLLNVAMGGTFGGTVDPAVSSATMEVDYIRVYK
jgi:beta-glucanase (GH16 family)